MVCVVCNDICMCVVEVQVIHYNLGQCARRHVCMMLVYVLRCMCGGSGNLLCV